MFVGKRDRL